MTEAIRVLVVDDSAYSRRTISEILESTGVCRVVGMARDGEDGIKKAIELKPDLITLDLEMPKMDGFTFLRILMKSMPTPILVISNMVHRKLVFRAMELGAIDFLAKPDSSINADLYDIKEDLINKIKIVGQLQMLNIERRIKRGPLEELAEPGLRPRGAARERAQEGEYLSIVIGSSTGGPSALQEVLSGLPGDIPVSIAISQHMPAGFTRAFAERLNKYSEWNVKEADDNEPINSGNAYVCPGGYHMTFASENGHKVIKLLQKKPGDKYVPSIDELFISAAHIYGPKLLGIVLTGMGNDGTAGSKEIKKQGGSVFAESAETAIVYGMPREVTECGAADKCLALDSISKEIVKIFAKRKNDSASNLEKNISTMKKRI